MSIVNDTPATVKDAKIASQMLALRQVYIDRLNVEHALNRIRLDVLDFTPRTDEGKEEKSYLLGLLCDILTEVRNFYSSLTLNDAENALTQYGDILERLQEFEGKLASLRNM